MKDLDTVENQWKDFANKIGIRKETHRVQHEEMRKAFFAGSASLMFAMERIGEPDISEQQGMEYLDQIKDEHLAFVEEIKRQS